jgi:outer membrane protein OmpA-like peptidoglycan-associated protein
MNSGRDILNGLFGGGLNTGIESVARFLGLRNSSVTSLLRIAAPLILGVLGKERSAQGLSVGGLANLLTGQKSLLAGLVPAGLAGLLGSRSPGRETSSIDAASRQEKAPAWVWPALGLAALGLLLYLYTARPTITAPDLKSAQLSLPDGKTLALKAGSLTHSLAGFLGSGGDTASAKPLVFDNLNFEFGSAKLTADSEQTVNELVAILNAYPSVQVKLDGFTDNAGDAAENRKLSQARADAIKDLLVRSGIDSGRITTAGNGPDRPIASNDTDEGRAKNRRLELTVVKK